MITQKREDLLIVDFIPKTFEPIKRKAYDIQVFLLLLRLLRCPIRHLIYSIAVTRVFGNS
jgi:hypothetical protein